MLTAKEVREKAREFIEIQKQKQLKKEEDQLNEIQKAIMRSIERDATVTTLFVMNIYKNNLAKLEELGFSYEIGTSSFGVTKYHISWQKINI